MKHWHAVGPYRSLRMESFRPTENCYGTEPLTQLERQSLRESREIATELLKAPDEQTEKDRVFRNAVLEEAALACAVPPTPYWREAVMARQCAERIRALKVSTPEKPAVQP